MSRDPLASIGGVSTPQSRPIPGREAEMVRNNAGGYTFAKDVWQRLEDFIILGTEGGTYYLGQDRLTLDNVQVVNEAVAQDGVRAVKLATQISASRPPRAPKNKGALFVLAYAAANGDAEAKQAVKDNLVKVARTTDHLSTFFGYWKNMSGKPTGRGSAPVIGRTMRSAFGSWFTEGSLDRVAWKALKARQRKTPQGEQMALLDVLRIAHPTPDTPGRKALFGWLAGNVTDEEARERVQAIDDFLTAQAVKTPRQAIRVISERKVPWEYLPDTVLKSPQVWEHLIDTIGMTALIRNLSRMTQNGAIKPFSVGASRAVERLIDEREVLAGRIHPMQAYLALKVYGSGFAQPNPKAPARTWQPVSEIMDALEQTYELAFGTVEPTGKRMLLAVDSSGSMSFGSIVVGGSRLGGAYETANAMAVILARIEGGNVYVIDVDTSVHASRVTKRTNLRELAHWRPSGGGTNLSLPFEYAERQRMEVDGIVVFTDNETWAGRFSHPTEALMSYRRRVNPATRVVVASMTAAGHTIADPKDEGVLNIAGLDASLPQVVNGYLR